VERVEDGLAVANRSRHEEIHWQAINLRHQPCCDLPASRAQLNDVSVIVSVSVAIIEEPACPSFMKFHSGVQGYDFVGGGVGVLVLSSGKNLDLTIIAISKKDTQNSDITQLSCNELTHLTHLATSY
jgi:hypothetical protein